VNFSLRDIERALEVIDHVPGEHLQRMRARLGRPIVEESASAPPNIDVDMLACAFYLAVTSDAGLEKWFAQEAP
jgi:hypothetical protein